MVLKRIENVFCELIEKVDECNGSFFHHSQFSDAASTVSLSVLSRQSFSAHHLYTCCGLVTFVGEVNKENVCESVLVFLEHARH